MSESKQPDTLSTISLVVPALNEAENVPGLLMRLRQLAQAHAGYDFELVLVDDGSEDHTAEKLLELTEPGEAITVVRLSRSFGSHYAISAGMTRCSGDCAIVLGADLQEPMSMVSDLISQWENGSDVVWGIRRSRTAGSMANRWASKSFSYLFSKFTDLSNYPAEGPSGVLVDRVVIDAVGALPEGNRNVYALIAWVGFSQSRIWYDQKDRRHGSSRWTKRKMLKLAIDSFLQFSSTPLRIFSLAGLIVAMLGAVYAVVLIVRGLMGIETPSGWPTVLVIVLVLGGTQLTMIGLIGEYLWRGVEETRHRPLYVVSDVYVADHGIARAQRPRRGNRPHQVDFPDHIRATDQEESAP